MDKPFCLIDIGADGGVHKRWKKIFPINTVLFEPDIKGFQQLQQNRSKNATILNTAIAGKSERAKFHICKAASASSLLQPNLSILKKYRELRDFDILEEKNLSTQSLDEALKQNKIENPDFLKIDAQGITFQILKGSDHTLKQLIGLEVEVGFLETYKKEVLFPDIHELLKSYGFELFNLRRCFWKRRNTDTYRHSSWGQLAFADALYFKTPETLILKGKSEQKLCQAATGYFAYQLYDLIEEMQRTVTEQKEKFPQLQQLLQIYLQSSKKRFSLPDFRGKRKIYNYLLRFARFFETNQHVGYIDSTICNCEYD